MARPSPYDPTTDFADFSADNPGRPMRGQDLDVEFNAIEHSLDETQAWLAGITGDDGGLATGIVQSYHLAPGLVDVLAGDIYAVVGPTAQQAAGSAAAAQVEATNAKIAMLAAQTAANAAYGQGDIAFEARQGAQQVLNETYEVQNTAQAYSIDASNFANHALGHANAAALSEDLANKWAEFIGGPVSPSEPLDPDAYDDGYWSAKWWALQAARWVHSGGVPGEGGDGVPGLAGPEGFGVVVYSLGELAGLLGPLDGDVSLVATLEEPSIWKFAVLDSTPAGPGSVVPGDGSAGRWLKLAFAAGEGGGIEFYEQPTEPVGASAGALWIDTSDEV